jgi:hypothetical protein
MMIIIRAAAKILSRTMFSSSIPQRDKLKRPQFPKETSSKGPNSPKRQAQFPKETACKFGEFPKETGSLLSNSPKRQAQISQFPKETG